MRETRELTDGENFKKSRKDATMANRGEQRRTKANKSEQMRTKANKGDSFAYSTFYNIYSPAS